MQALAERLDAAVAGAPFAGAVPYQLSALKTVVPAPDILHRARLSPYATLAGLDADERQALVAATREVLTDGLAAEQKRSGGLPTKVGDHFTTHGRYGSSCPRCGTDLRRVSYESHEVT